VLFFLPEPFPTFPSIKILPSPVRSPCLSPTRRDFLQKASAFSFFSASALAQQAISGEHAMPGMHMGQTPVVPKPGEGPQNSSSPLPSGAAAPPIPLLHSLELPPFVDALPIPQRLHARPGKKLRIAMREVHAKVHRDVPAARFWTYADADSPATSNVAAILSPVIEARSHQPLQIEWINHLPTQHFLPIDHSLHGCGRDIPDVRTCVHVHGARTMSKDDGQPEDWYVPGHSRISSYPLEQDATALWYHDHAMGLNRLNLYAGLLGSFFIRDDAEDALNLPSGPYEIPLQLFDRDFTKDGQLFYPTSPDPEHPWVPEFAADAILLNGKIRPYLEVEPRQYRFRVLNAANSRFFALSLTGHQPFHQIGSDQGLLAAPVSITTLTIAPAERADLLIDFSQSAGKKIHLINAAFEVLEFRVAAKPSSPAVITLPKTLRTIERTPASSATVTRTITLNEYQDNIGNAMLMLLNRKRWHEPVTETPKLNSTEIWEFVNLTEDVHPMHLHLVRFQVLDRRVFEPFDYLMYKKLSFRGPAFAPEKNELGWKDTVQCPPGIITRIIARFDGYPGKYLYHCHILEHEANDMMRPFEVIA